MSVTKPVSKFKIFNQPIDLNKVNEQVLKSWVIERLSTRFPDDEIVIDFALELVFGTGATAATSASKSIYDARSRPVRSPDAARVREQLRGFFGGDGSECDAFCHDLWELLVEAQNNAGVPPSLIAAKREEMREAQAARGRPRALRPQYSDRDSGAGMMKRETGARREWERAERRIKREEPEGDSEDDDRAYSRPARRSGRSRADSRERREGGSWKSRDRYGDRARRIKREDENEEDTRRDRHGEERHARRSHRRSASPQDSDRSRLRSRSRSRDRSRGRGRRGDDERREYGRHGRRGRSASRSRSRSRSRGRARYRGVSGSRSASPVHDRSDDGDDEEQGRDRWGRSRSSKVRDSRESRGSRRSARSRSR